MSLAFSPFNDDDDMGDLMTKKKTHNRTQRNTNNNNNDKVSNMLHEIHINQTIEDDGQLGDFSPPPKPQSSGVEKTKETNTQHVDFQKENVPKPLDTEDQLNKQSYASNNTTTKSVDDFYKITPHSTINRSLYNETQNDGGILLKKVNYMIHLMEEQQDERTSYVTEEVIMYSFLGIFIIFVVDSFVRVGKYVR
jgi:hypothetical protein